MNGDEVGRGEQCVEANAFDAKRSKGVPRDERIVSENLEAERLGLGNEGARDIAEAHEAQRLAP